MPNRRGEDRRDDRELVAAMNGGDVAAFEVLYERYSGWVLDVACRFTRDADLAEDVVQETFRYFLGKFPGFELTAKLTTFLYPVVRNTALRQRERARRCQRPDADPGERAIDPEISDLDLDLANMLAGLPERLREALLLHYVDDLSIADVADALAVPEGTVKSRLHHARRMLREDPRSRAYFRASDPDRAEHRPHKPLPLRWLEDSSS
jgi:RNA polymerase sigma-70 factor (ECF subfamily)